MAYVSVPKDLTKVKNKVAFNLTKRQLICIGIGAAVGIPFFFLTRDVLGMTNAMTIMVFLMLPAFMFYVYNHCVDGCNKIEGRYGQDEMVWYVSYGSNMLEERLKYYITGGTCLFNGMSYFACNDRTLPCESRKVEIPFDMFYSNYGMGSWSDSAVAFLDMSKPGFSYGRAYKIKKNQLEELHSKEGKSIHWYPECIRLEDIEGIPTYTFAGFSAKKKEPFSRVSAEYGIVLYKGMKETYPELTDKEILRYLQNCGRNH